MLNTDDIARQVLHNCDISDANNAGMYSICGLALRLRDLYKWEQGLPPWEERDSSEVLEWIEAKENQWDQCIDNEFADISINGKTFDPFDTQRHQCGFRTAQFFLWRRLRPQPETNFFSGSYRRKVKT